MAVTLSKLSVKEEHSDSLLLENVEALASGEGSVLWCIGTGNTICPDTGAKVYYTKEPYSLR